ncbi:hypothetical protein FNP_1413 [Fusobacterium polymorphum ATCC 10953]|uniref:Uncharacterized protein n=1 Tax=Fusobacterium polymorphum ATCC 10953 TaxID=393480 RepID=A5TWC0_FUSNP|nr:hypothetical protein FNP_1413 [Fusobacterium polymorphum ATCC 10953]
MTSAALINLVKYSCLSLAVIILLQAIFWLNTLIFFFMSTFVNNLCPMLLAVFLLYLAFIAELVAFPVLIYSCINNSCLCVICITSLLGLYHSYKPNIFLCYLLLSFLSDFVPLMLVLFCSYN